MTALAQSPANLTLTGWDIDSKNPAAFVQKAAMCGFDELIVYASDPVPLRAAVEAGKLHGVRIFFCVQPREEFAEVWNALTPGRPVPWQKMTWEQEAAAAFLKAGNNRKLVPYQWGGEPLMTNEVWTKPIPCFNDPDVRKTLRVMTEQACDIPGIAGVAFDGFGFQNYHRCHCDRCCKLFEEYVRSHPGASPEEAETVFFRDELVGLINEMAAVVRSKNPELKTAIHLWPVFAPEPLYGNRLDVDFCGQTAAWYTLWPQEKIANYTRVIVERAADFYPRQKGVGMLGYYNLPKLFPEKSPHRIAIELQTMLENGCQYFQVGSAKDVVKNPDIAKVFENVFGANREASPPSAPDRKDNPD